MTNSDDNSPFTVWQSIEALTRAILHTQKELVLMKSSIQKMLEKGVKFKQNGPHEVKITLEDENSIVALPKIGYHMINDELIIRNYATAEEVKIPRDFHYLKVVKFNHYIYKLTFCNELGNEFFEYKKYDPQYYNLSEEYKFLDLDHVKTVFTPKLNEHYGYVPSFFITHGLLEPGLKNYSADLFELVEGRKGKKVGTLRDEYGYFDSNNHLHYCDYHKDTSSNIYNSDTLDIKVENIGVNKLHLITEGDDISLHPIQENLDIF